MPLAFAPTYTYNVSSHSPTRTQSIANVLGAVGEPGSVLTLSGPLGAGKSLFAEGVLRGCGVSARDYEGSPTFVLAIPYQGRFPIWHLDLYRLGEEAENEWDAMGWDELFNEETLLVIEWPEQVEHLLPADRLHVNVQLLSLEERRLQFAAGGPHSVSWLKRLLKRLGVEGDQS